MQRPQSLRCSGFVLEVEPCIEAFQAGWKRLLASLRMQDEMACALLVPIRLVGEAAIWRVHPACSVEFFTWH